MGLSYDHWAGDKKLLKDIEVSLHHIKKEKHKMVRDQRCRRLKNKADKIQQSEVREKAKRLIEAVEEME